ncbi:LytR C-terminal domain-containing protein [Nocardia amamiensis]|uniref:LytR C-terminal domain-containing protein n=1 Tax=Nocardia amamiensis TaxID=404578 RepID=A0ABS0CRP5_9NOCA|nr:LytR C-terminal domain-containing protein [Nocardia amamiensis]
MRRRTISLAVLNASEQTGIARTAAAKLGNQGFQIYTTDNFPKERPLPPGSGTRPDTRPRPWPPRFPEPPWRKRTSSAASSRWSSARITPARSARPFLSATRSRTWLHPRRRPRSRCRPTWST